MVRLLKPIIEGEQNIYKKKKKKKKKGSKAERSKFHVKGLNPRISHLVFRPELGNEDNYAIP